MKPHLIVCSGLCTVHVNVVAAYLELVMFSSMESHWHGRSRKQFTKDHNCLQIMFHLNIFELSIAFHSDDDQLFY